MSKQATNKQTTIASAVKATGNNCVIVDGHKIASDIDNRVRAAIVADIKSVKTWRELAVPLVCAFWDLDAENPESWPSQIEADSDGGAALYAYLLSRDPRMNEADKPARGDVSEKARAQRLARKDASALASTTRANILKYWREATKGDDAPDGEEITPEGKKKQRAGFDAWILKTKSDLTNKIQGKNTPEASRDLFSKTYAIIAMIERIGPSVVLEMLKADAANLNLETPINPGAIEEKVRNRGKKAGEVKVISGAEYQAG